MTWTKDDKAETQHDIGLLDVVPSPVLYSLGLSWKVRVAMLAASRSRVPAPCKETDGCAGAPADTPPTAASVRLVLSHGLKEKFHNREVVWGALVLGSVS